MTARTPERERLLKRLVVTLTLLLLFGLGEAGLRLYEAFTPYISKTEPYLADHRYLGRTLKPDAYYANGVAQLQVNAEGFRGKPLHTPKPEGSYRIFALGGSTTFGHFPDTRRDETTYPAVLETLLNAQKPDPAVTQYEVVNAGVPGFSVRTSLANFLFRVLYYQPDAIIIYHNTNDLSRYGNEANLLHPLHNQFMPEGMSTGLLDHFLGSSYLVQEIRYTLNNRFSAGHPAPAAPPTQAWVLDTRYPEAFRRDLRNLVVVAKANGVLPVLASQAIAFTPQTDFARLTAAERQMRFDRPALFYATVPPTQRYALFRHYNQIIQEVAAAEAVPFVDVDALMPKTPEYHTDYCHLTDRGSALQAEIIYRALTQALRPQLAAITPPAATQAP